MKAYSVDLDTKVSLTREEVERLKTSPLEGFVKVREINGEQGREIEIPMTIVYQPTQKEIVEIRLKPERTYFGHAKKIIFIINEYFYASLREKGSCGNRFWSSGKLIINRENADPQTL